MYVTSTGEIYNAPRITATKLAEYRRNYYGASVTRKLRALFFGSDYEIEVTGPTGDPDDTLQDELTDMATRADLWNAMRIGWEDKVWLGTSIFNPVWDLEGTRWTIDQIRRLPPESFGPAAGKSGEHNITAGKILKGIYADKQGTVYYWQTTRAGESEQIKNIHVVRDRTSTDVAGDPDILPITAVITMLDFAWKAQMQKINRIGAPILMLKVNMPTGDDIAYANKIMKNWGKDTAYQLRENMEVVDFNFKNTETAAQTIDTLAQMILDYWVPSSMINGKDGSLISSGDGSALQLLYGYIAGIHRDIEAAWEPLLQQYLDVNGYHNYRAKITIPDPVQDNSELQLEQAKAGAETGRLTDNEIRTRLGADEMTDEELALLPANAGQNGGPLGPEPGAGGPVKPEPVAPLEEEWVETTKDDPEGKWSYESRIYMKKVPLKHSHDPHPVSFTDALMGKTTKELVDVLDELAGRVIGTLKE